MEYYDWKNIVKTKTIIELKKIIDGNLLGKDARNYAIIELLKRYERKGLLEKNNIDIQKINLESLIERGDLSKEESEYLNTILNTKFQSEDELSTDEIKKLERKIYRMSYMIGIFQIIGGLLLIIGLTNVNFKALNLKDSLMVLIQLCIALFSIIAGIYLLSNRKLIILSTINQFLQLIHFKTSVFTFSYYSAGALLTGFSFMPSTQIVFLKSIFFISKVELNWSNGSDIDESFLLFNILCIIVLYNLSSLKKLIIKINKASKHNAPEAMTTALTSQ